MIFMPHGLDEMFGVKRITPDCPILPRFRGLVADRVLDIPEGRRRYLQRVADLYHDLFDVNAILKRLSEVNAVIRPIIAESGPQATQNHDRAVADLTHRLLARHESLQRQVARLPRLVPVEDKGLPIPISLEDLLFKSRTSNSE